MVRQRSSSPHRIDIDETVFHYTVQCSQSGEVVRSFSTAGSSPGRFILSSGGLMAAGTPGSDPKPICSARRLIPDTAVWNCCGVGRSKVFRKACPQRNGNRRCIHACMREKTNKQTNSHEGRKCGRNNSRSSETL